MPADTTGEWLTVNVWTPDPEARTLPVMVWIHGGAYLFGAGGPGYDGTPFASAGAVFVSCNYRLGMEGFAQIAGAPANRGLLDAVAALRWVRDNIERFGGDPGNVTVFGESAGAGVISALLAMDDAKGLFKRAIAQSVPGTFFSTELAGRITEAIAATAGLPADYQALREADPMRLVAAQMDVTARMKEFLDWGAVRITDTPFSPVIDGEVLTRTPWRALVSGAARDVELLTGHNRDEYRLFIAAQRQARHDHRRRGGHGPRLLRPSTRRAGRLPEGVPRRGRGRPVRGGLLRLAVPHADPAPGPGARDVRRHDVPVRADGAGTRADRSAPATRSTFRSSSATTASAAAGR